MTDSRSELRDHLDIKGDPPSKNRVWGFRASATHHARQNAPQPVETASETSVTVTTTVSGILYWLSEDPIGEQGGINLYGYCDNDPVNLRDELGLDVLVAIGPSHGTAQFKFGYAAVNRLMEEIDKRIKAQNDKENMNRLEVARQPWTVEQLVEVLPYEGGGTRVYEDVILWLKATAPGPNNPQPGVSMWSEKNRGYPVQRPLSELLPSDYYEDLPFRLWLIGSYAEKAKEHYKHIDYPQPGTKKDSSSPISLLYLLEAVASAVDKQDIMTKKEAMDILFSKSIKISVSIPMNTNKEIFWQAARILNRWKREGIIDEDDFDPKPFLRKHAGDQK